MLKKLSDQLYQLIVNCILWLLTSIQHDLNNSSTICLLIYHRLKGYSKIG